MFVAPSVPAVVAQPVAVTASTPALVMII